MEVVFCKVFGCIQKCKRGILLAQRVSFHTGLFGTRLELLPDHTGMFGTHSGTVLYTIPRYPTFDRRPCEPQPRSSVPCRAEGVAYDPSFVVDRVVSRSCADFIACTTRCAIHPYDISRLFAHVVAVANLVAPSPASLQKGLAHVKRSRSFDWAINQEEDWEGGGY